MKIVLLRHGEPDFVAHWLEPKNGARRALDLYAESRVTIKPPVEIQELNTLPDICITSKLARAVDSARLLGVQDPIESELFNESELPHPNRLYIPLPWKLFLLIYRLLWLVGFRQNCAGKSRDRQRAREGSRFLSRLAGEHDSVLLLGHGIMNRLLCSELQKIGWSIDAENGSGYWSTITLSCKTAK